jgi:hypothetical protein
MSAEGKLARRQHTHGTRSRDSTYNHKQQHLLPRVPHDHADVADVQSGMDGVGIIQLCTLIIRTSTRQSSQHGLSTFSAAQAACMLAEQSLTPAAARRCR